MLKGFLKEMEDLLSELMQDIGGLFIDQLFDNFGYSSMGAYVECPSRKLFIDKETEPDADLETEESGEEPEDEEEQEDEEGPVPKPTPTPYISGVEIRRVFRHVLGYNIIGRAFPYLKVIEIANDLYGDEFEEVKLHEFIHIEHPELSEWQVRMRTRASLPFATKWN